MQHVASESARLHNPVVPSNDIQMHDLRRNRSRSEEQCLLEDSSLDQDVQKNRLRNLYLSFFLFGVINEVLYVIILSAALDLVPPSTPKGIIAFCNITPGLIAKIRWSYFVKGKVHYVQRLAACCLLSFFGMIVVAGFDSLNMRLLGICFASFSGGLSELTFLQLSSTYAPASVAGQCVGYFAAGTGAAGLLGAFAWWELRNLGVPLGMGISSVLPFLMPLTYFCLLPPASYFPADKPPADFEGSREGPSTGYIALPTDDHETRRDTSAAPILEKAQVTLSASDKWRIVRPLLVKYILPLFTVYVFEYNINQGVSPTLLYPVPQPGDHPILSKIIHSIRDYYPLWQLVYQTTVFLSRSSISIGIPPLPAKLLPLPSIVQGFILTTLAFEAAVGIFPPEANGISIMFVFLLVSIEGVCGGLAYVNVYYHINQERPKQASSDAAEDQERIKQEKEFKIGSIGFAGASGVLFATLVAIPTEVSALSSRYVSNEITLKFKTVGPSDADTLAIQPVLKSTMLTHSSCYPTQS